MGVDKDKVIELLVNEDFKKWVLKPTYERDLFWNKWLERNPEQEETVNVAKEFILSAKFKKPGLSPDAKDEILSNIISQTPPKHNTDSFTDRKDRNRLFQSFSVFKIAATITIIAGFAGAFWLNKINTRTHKDIVKELTFVKKENPQGRKSTIMLPDGTKVILNSSSTLTYDSNYGDQDRTVRISGEAFFDVLPNYEKPFNVVSGNIVTTALGTSFNVRAFESESTLKISLLTGKVKVVDLTKTDTETEYMLLPGEGFIIEKPNGELKKVKVEPLMEFGWKDGILVFADNDLDEVVQALERWYGIKISIIGQPKKQWRVDGRFDNETLEQVLQGLSFTYDLEYLITGEIVELKL
jgi:transmembrane sensor